jgi:hypothetical protein
MRPPISIATPLLIALIALPAATQSAARGDRAAECGVGSIDVDRRIAAASLTELVSSRLTVDSIPAHRRAVSPTGPSSFIDDEIFGAMKAAGITPAPPASDEEFLRRVTLDLTGQIPASEDVENFLADPRPNKRALVIDRLLASDDFNDRWALFLGDLLRDTAQPFVGAVAAPYRNDLHDFLRASMRDAKPYDQLVRELITAKGHGGQVPAVNFLIRDHLLGTDPKQDVWDNLAVSTHRAFLGVNIFCISCHNGIGHTTQLSPWLSGKRREQFWESAAFFANTQIRPANGPDGTFDMPFEVAEEAGEYRLDTTSGNKTPRQPELANGTDFIAPAFLLTGERPAPGENRRAALARMILRHPQFARATVNYLWKELFTAGIVEPANGFDLLRQDPATTPSGWSVQPTHPRLLERLGDYFVKSGYDLRAVLRVLANSNAYQLSSAYRGEWRADYARYFARHFARRLRSEELLDAVSAATGVWEPIAVRDRRTSSRSVERAGQLPDVVEPLEVAGPEVRPLLDAFLRGNRNDAARSDDLALSQTLMLLNNTAILRKVEAPASRGHQWLESGAAPEAIVQRLYVATLGRKPAHAESEAATALLTSTSGDARVQAIEDLQYALLNKVEFVFNH